jgi:hypothetical protein
VSDYSACFNFLDQKLGDRWVGMTIGPVLINAVAPAVTLDRVRIHFRNGTLIYRLDSDATLRDAPITITTAATWLVTIPAVESGFLPAGGSWNYDAEFTGTGQGPVTLFKGSIFVHTDITT